MKNVKYNVVACARYVYNFQIPRDSNLFYAADADAFRIFTDKRGRDFSRIEEMISVLRPSRDTFPRRKHARGVSRRLQITRWQPIESDKRDGARHTVTVTRFGISHRSRRRRNASEYIRCNIMDIGTHRNLDLLVRRLRQGRRACCGPGSRQSISNMIIHTESKTVVH